MSGRVQLYANQTSMSSRGEWYYDKASVPCRGCHVLAIEVSFSAAGPYMSLFDVSFFLQVFLVNNVSGRRVPP